MSRRLLLASLTRSRNFAAPGARLKLSVKAETVTGAKGQGGAPGAVLALAALIKIPAEQRAANGGTHGRAGGKMAQNPNTQSISRLVRQI